jgi:radical SAM enzyme (TIGR01210 family)
MISERSEKPLASWRGKERYENQQLECLTVIFRSGGCSWSGCRMCSYRHERYAAESSEALYDHFRAQLAWVMNEYDPDEYRMVKIFTSGSFFDPTEVPPAFLADVARSFRGKIVIAETRPEFIREDVLVPFLSGIDDGSWKKPLYCAMGLETSSDAIREKCINKGFSFRNFRDAAGRARKAGAGVKAYLLFKPLFLSERESIDDMKASFADTIPLADMISMNPCTVQKNTELEYYWKRGAYRPPYLWSVLTLLLAAPVHVTCDPLGGGQKRGPHNCGTCDVDIVKGIREYSLNGDRDLLGALLDIPCGCKREWEFVLEQEKPYCMPLTR